MVRPIPLVLIVLVLFSLLVTANCGVVGGGR